jgi:glutamine synthetase
MHEGNVHVSAIMSIDELRAAVEADSVDTVVLAMPDMLGRLQGKRLDARHFLDDVVKAGAEACSYLLTVDVDMGIVEGFDISGWSNGLGDFTLAPDLTTLRRIPWMPGSSIVLADATWADGAPVVQSPRQILQRQIARLAEHGWGAQVATERTAARTRRTTTVCGPAATSTTTTRCRAPRPPSRSCGSSDAACATRA